jgi:hypothetical protein
LVADSRSLDDLQALGDLLDLQLGAGRSASSSRSSLDLALEVDLFSSSRIASAPIIARELVAVLLLRLAR